MEVTRKMIDAGAKAMADADTPDGPSYLTLAEHCLRAAMAAQTAPLWRDAAIFPQLPSHREALSAPCSDCPPEGYPTDETRCGPCHRRLKALRHYADQYCEGWCKDAPVNANFDDCGGCRARLVLPAPSEGPAHG